jgi:hypothetical protein
LLWPRLRLHQQCLMMWHLMLLLLLLRQQQHLKQLRMC